MPTSISTFTKYLAANEIWKVNATGTTVRGVAGAQPYKLSPAGQNPIKQMQTGIAVTFETAFNLVEIQNGDTAQTIVIWIGDGLIQDNRLVGSVDISGGIRISGNLDGDYGTVSVTTSATLIRAANIERSSCLVVNVGANDMHIGTDSSVTAANGIPVLSGQSLTFTVETTIYGISTGGANDVRYLDEVT
tara:strand:- start:1855 stop:2424 length:570 start_codon:yes stop_codon:yes gene_type:complete